MAREPRVCTASYSEVAALKLQLEKALGGQGVAYTILGAARLLVDTRRPRRLPPAGPGRDPRC